MKGAQVRAIREELGYSQEVMAELLGYARKQSMSDIERDKMPISRPALILLSHLVLLSKLADRAPELMNDDDS